MYEERGLTGGRARLASQGYELLCKLAQGGKPGTAEGEAFFSRYGICAGVCAGAMPYIYRRDLPATTRALQPLKKKA